MSNHLNDREFSLGVAADSSLEVDSVKIKKNFYNDEPKKVSVKKRKKIVITTIKKDPLDNLNNKIKDENDFMAKITMLLKTSKRCQECESLKILAGKSYMCTNFQALWHHRDHNFSNFEGCKYQKAKRKTAISTN